MKKTQLYWTAVWRESPASTKVFEGDIIFKTANDAHEWATKVQYQQDKPCIYLGCRKKIKTTISTPEEHQVTVTDA